MNSCRTPSLSTNSSTMTRSWAEKLGERAVTDKARSPSARCAAQARYAESAPPERATITEERLVSRERRKASFSSVLAHVASPERIRTRLFIPKQSISQSPAESVVSRTVARALFEIQKDVHGCFGGVRLQPMPDVRCVVMNGQFTKDLLLMGLQFLEEFFELGLVEDVARNNGPGGVHFAFAGKGKPGEDHFAIVILNALLNADRVGDGVRVVVERCNRIKFCIQITAMTVLFANAIQACFQLQAIGDVAGFDSE